MSGWGSGAWGGSFWGSGVGAPRLLSAVAIRENCVRLTFDLPVVYDRTGRPRDGARTALYGVAPVPGTVSLTGEAARPVLVGRVDLGGGGNTLLDLWLDRALTGWPARYVATAHGLYGVDGVQVDPTATSATLDGVRAGVVQRDPANDATVIGADLALPQTEAAALIARASGALLGSYAVDATGDFAFDAGLQSLIKRILRRVFTVPAAFRHLPDDYGMGLGRSVKRLATATERARLAGEAARQCRLEPEVAGASAEFRALGGGAWELRLKVRTRVGQEFEFGSRVGA